MCFCAGDFEHMMSTNLQVVQSIQSLIKNVRNPDGDSSLMPDPFGSPLKGGVNPVSSQQAYSSLPQVLQYTISNEATVLRHVP